MAKISIVMPAYNVGDCIGNVLDSILNQSFKNFELIVINDGSTDNTLDVLNEYAFKDKRVKVINQKNGGAAHARNVGIKAASGDYITFIDSDDDILEDMLLKLYDKTVSDNLDICVCDYYYKDNDKLTYCNARSILTNENVKDYLLSFVAPWGKIIKKDMIVSNSLYFYENHYYEDLAVVPAYGLYTLKIGFINEPLYVYVHRENSLMNQPKYNSKFCDVFVSLEYLCEFFLKEKLFEKYYSELEFIYISHLLHDSTLRILPFDEAKEELWKINNIMKDKFPKWKLNKYFKSMSLKYKIVCYLIESKKFRMLKKILKM